MSLWDERVAFQKDVRKLTEYAESLGYEVLWEEVKRTLEQQQIYFATNRTKTMKSQHLNGTAIDMAFKKDGKLTYDVPELGLFWENLHPRNRWGGNFDKDWGKKDGFVDKPHFERKV
jgi:hypothetical protein